MKSLALTLFIIFIFIPLSSPARSDEDIFELEEVVVTATRTEESVLDVPQHVTVITEEDIKRSGSKNLAEVLSVHTGVSISDYGPAGAIQSLSIRGSTSSQVLVLIDGVRAVGSHGGADLSLIPLDNIERIEIVRGGTSALYGADAVGGVINIITKKKADDKLKIFIENGSYIPQKALKGTESSERESDPAFLDMLDTQEVSIDYSKKVNNLNFFTSGSFIKANNEFVFIDTTDKKRKRDNAAIIGGNISTGFHINFPSGFFDATGFALYHERGIPGKLGSLTPDATQKDLQAGGNIGYKTDHFFTDYLTFDLKTFFNCYRVDYEDPMSVDSTHNYYTTGLDVAQELLVFDSFSLIYGGNLNYERIDSTDMGMRERIYSGGFIEGAFYLASRFTLQPVLRYDYYSDFEGSLNYKLGGVYNLSRTASIKGSISRSYRAPTFNDLYWPEDAFFKGNPDLKPEIGYSIDFGLSVVKENILYDLFWFTRYIKDVILWQPGDDGLWRPSNYGEGIYPGIESQVQVNFLEYFSFTLNYTFLYTFALTGGYTFEDNKRFPDIPVHAIDAGFSYHRNKNNLSVNTHYQSLRYHEIENRSYLPSYFLVNIHYKRILTDHFSLLFSIDNVFNKSYESMSNYPMPGLFIRTGIEAVF